MTPEWKERERNETKQSFEVEPASKGEGRACFKNQYDHCGKVALKAKFKEHSFILSPSLPHTYSDQPPLRTAWSLGLTPTYTSCYTDVQTQRHLGNQSSIQKQAHIDIQKTIWNRKWTEDTQIAQNVLGRYIWAVVVNINTLIHTQVQNQLRDMESREAEF